MSTTKSYFWLILSSNWRLMHNPNGSWGFNWNWYLCYPNSEIPRSKGICYKVNLRFTCKAPYSARTIPWIKCATMPSWSSKACMPSLFTAQSNLRVFRSPRICRWRTSF